MCHKIHFGTAGLREIMGPEKGQMNLQTIGTVTQALSNYINTFPKNLSKNGVVICHDSRIHSRSFALEAAKVLAGNAIAVHITKDLRPTPFASFCILYYKSIAGINITASHNPKEYNGYKVYWSDGSQITPPHDLNITDEIDRVSQIKKAPLDSPLIKEIGANVETAYLKAIEALSIQTEENKAHGKELSILYSPLNGAGMTMIPPALNLWGFKNIDYVEEQKMPDGTFPTTPYPNPETKEALFLGIQKMKKTKKDILLVSDPDSDRLSCSFLYNGFPKTLSGNELGSILLDYLISHLKPKKKWATIASIVSTPLIKKMTEISGGSFFEVPTGFKYIGKKIGQWETEKDSYAFLFGMEESLGFLYGTHSRDKDATIAACLTAEIALHLKKRGKTLLDQLFEIYAKFGIYREAQTVISSSKGIDFLLSKVEDIRKTLPKKLFSIPVIKIKDYQLAKEYHLETKKSSFLSLPKSNTLAFFLKDHSCFFLRPSGTEPTIKIYAQMHEKKGPYPLEQQICSIDNHLQQSLLQLKKQFFT